jgi:serine/threonine protein phosphatase PrpC
MRVQAGVATDIGRVRERNEDSFLANPPLFAVADGMGGHRGGAVASELALERVDELNGTGKASLGDMVRAANRAVFERSMTDRAVTGMGTTLTAVTVDDDGVHLAHVGDSRAYLLRAGALRQLTDDHTLVNRMVQAGEITRDEADVHPHRNVVTRALGTEPDVDVDERDIPVIEGDRVVLCSDGLTGMVNEPQIQAILEATPNPQEAADRLIKAANRAGGVDNITVVVLDIHEGAGSPDDAPARMSSSTATRPSPQTIKRWVVRVAIALVCVVAVFFVARMFIDRQWYVGGYGGRVAVFQGIPAELAGLRLSHVEFETDIPLSDVIALPLYRSLSDGITANDREEALAIVEQIRADVRAASETTTP